jgi:hypothetical protein
VLLKLDCNRVRLRNVGRSWAEGELLCLQATCIEQTMMSMGRCGVRLDTLYVGEQGERRSSSNSQERDMLDICWP